MKFEGTEQEIIRLFAVEERAQLAFFKLLHQQGLLQVGSGSNGLNQQTIDAINQLALPAAHSTATYSTVPAAYPMATAAPASPPTVYPQTVLSTPTVAAPDPTPATVSLPLPAVRPNRRRRLQQWAVQHPGWVGLISAAVLLGVLYSTPLKGAIGNWLKEVFKQPPPG